VDIKFEQMKREHLNSVLSISLPEMARDVPVACCRRAREICHVFPCRHPQPAENANGVKLQELPRCSPFHGSRSTAK